MTRSTSSHRFTWEQAVEILRADPQHQQLIADAYLGADVSDNCRRFRKSPEFVCCMELLGRLAPPGRRLLDMPAGNGIAAVAFAAAGFEVTAVEPDASDSVGRGAIARAAAEASLKVNIVAAYGERLPFENEQFDIAYVRQGLHHAHELPRMVCEVARVLCSGGLLLACREHVVDNYGASLKAFLDSQVDHQLYGGENAFTVKDYRAAFAAAGLERIMELGPYDSPINTHPNDPPVLREKILTSVPGRVLRQLLGDGLTTRIGRWLLKRRKNPGRLFTFVLRKPR